MRHVPGATIVDVTTGEAEVSQDLGEVEFRLFYDQTVRPLRAWLRRMAGVEHVDDLTQEVYLRLLRTPTVNLPPDERRAYLYRVAANLVKDRWRAQKRQGGAAVDIDAVTLESRGHQSAEVIDLSRALTGLRLRERTMLWLAYVERATHREIALALDVKETSVRVLLSRARQKLAGALGARREGGS